MIIKIFVIVEMFWLIRAVIIFNVKEFMLLLYTKQFWNIYYLFIIKHSMKPTVFAKQWSRNKKLVKTRPRWFYFEDILLSSILTSAQNKINGVVYTNSTVCGIYIMFKWPVSLFVCVWHPNNLIQQNEIYLFVHNGKWNNGNENVTKTKYT